jgi:predicted ABC-type ATPase
VTQVLMIAGPNGAGKTTTAMALLPYLNIPEFVNADELARGLNPLNPDGQAIAAGKLMLQRMAQLTREGKSFGFETTGASVQHIKTLRRCKENGYKTTLAFLWLASPELAIQRVEHRVRNGGHFIPPDTIRRRYARGLHHVIHNYLPVVDHAVVYNNSSSIHAPTILYVAHTGSAPVIHDAALWQTILEQAHA